MRPIPNLPVDLSRQIQGVEAKTKAPPRLQRAKSTTTTQFRPDQENTDLAQLQRQVNQGRQAIEQEVVRQRGFNFCLADHLDSVKEQVANEFNRHIQILEDLDGRQRQTGNQVDQLQQEAQTWESRNQETTEWYAGVEERVAQLDTTLQEREGRVYTWATKAEESAKEARSDGQSARTIFAQMIPTKQK